MKPDLEILPGRFAIAKVRDFDGVRSVRRAETQA